MKTFKMIEETDIEDLRKDIKFIKSKLINHSEPSNVVKEYFTVGEASLITGLAKVTIRKKVTELEAKQLELEQQGKSIKKFIVRHGTRIKIPYDTLHNIILK